MTKLRFQDALYWVLAICGCGMAAYFITGGSTGLNNKAGTGLDAVIDLVMAALMGIYGIVGIFINMSERKKLQS